MKRFLCTCFLQLTPKAANNFLFKGALTRLNRKLFAAFGATLLFTLFLTGCQKKEPKSSKPTAVVSVLPYAGFLEKIAPGRFEIQSLVPFGANPHVYEPTPWEVEKIQNASLWIRLGESFDQKVFTVFQERKSPVAILNITEGIPLISSCNEGGMTLEHAHCHHDSEEGKDLHIWLSLRLIKQQASHIATFLSDLFPEDRTEFQKNLEQFLTELDQLDQTISQLLASKQGAAILVSHPAFGYFCRDYNLIQLSIEMEGKDPLPQEIDLILKQVEKYSVKSVFLEPQYSNLGAEEIARRLRLTTYTIDPYAENALATLFLLANYIAQ